MFFSIVITTYNAEAFILDALNSLKNQIFQDFEWIITDDCSTDKTVDICKTWMAENPEFLPRLKMIESKVNTGVSANTNRGLKVASGEWVHVLSGDDALLEHALESVHDFVCKNPEISVLQGVAAYYDTDFSEANFKGNLSENYKTSDFFNLPASGQYRLLLNSCHVISPAVFTKLRIAESVDFRDENIPMIDDWPLWLKLTKNGYRFYFLNQILVKYRLQKHSITNENQGFLVSDLHRKCRPVYRLYIAPNIGFFKKITYHLDYAFKEILYRFFNSSKNPISILTMKILRIFKKPFLEKNNQHDA